MIADVKWEGREMETAWTSARRLGDPVLLAALEYEDATLEALRALDGTDSEEQVVACLRFVAALEATYALPAEEHDRGLAYLVQRGRIPDFAWMRIHAAMELLAADLDPQVLN
jgi:hypothetical protein